MSSFVEPVDELVEDDGGGGGGGGGGSDFDIDSVDFGHEIGAGQFATVHAGIYSGQMVAIKTQVRETKALEEYLKRELEILQTMSNLHPNLIEFIGMADIERGDEWYLYVVTSFAGGGDLSTLLFENTELELGWRFRTTLASQIAEGLEYLHSQKVLHRDMKSENVLLDEAWTPKIADFGFARPIEGDGKYRMSICGTDEYMAPELMFDENYGYPADVFGLGMIIVEIIARRAVGKDSFAERKVQNNFQLDMDELRGALPEEAPPMLIELAMQCCDYEPDDRPAAGDAVGWAKEMLGDMPEEAAPDVPEMHFRRSGSFSHRANEIIRGPERGIARSVVFTSSRFVSDENERVGGADGDEGDEGMGRISLSSRHSLSSGDLGGGEVPLYSGYLYKKSTGMIKSWQKRWFELEGSTVRWMKNKGDDTFQFVELHSSMTCRDTDQNAHRFALFQDELFFCPGAAEDGRTASTASTDGGGSVTSGKKEVVKEFAARTPSEFALWITRLQMAIQDAPAPNATNTGRRKTRTTMSSSITSMGTQETRTSAVSMESTGPSDTKGLPALPMP
mmetsp:Transcript_15286/g.35383  ORF Transcript_15286/g.35383 Transcript_15286/m.35383 type:complete len:564 (-) Transcript_15286:732-2423(-)|eukprot:CAMPEP_0182566612 /NCGR_PEP_ID=MMETSP1324-20130603/8033_1 /TAXON_ID=236786 /ORGANISM="Florenciella sp., Strain RCC1587" /LENGTH=563 /DNA_ID=CAMNT_0024780445 /DNA_START=294 /DNA_END=1985 /DNA_ORIENTATION=+